jgi:DNA repair protein RecO (recombination protein O)
VKTNAHPCYILHHRPYRETSLILEVFSREHGRVSLVARGARRAANRQRPLFQTLRRLNIGWSTRGEMGTLTQIDAGDPPPGLAGESVITAFYLNELLMRLLHRHEPHPLLFDAYEQALDGLQRRGAREATLRIFEKRLLEALGYGLILDREIGGGAAVREDGEYYYVMEHGPGAEPRPGIECTRVSGATLVALYRERLSGEAQLAEAKRLLRMALAGHLGARPLASRDLYRKYRDVCL